MNNRKLPDDFNEPLYIEDYLHKLALEGKHVTHIPRESKLPKIKGETRYILSMFELAMQNE